MLRPVQFPKFNFIPQTFVNATNFHDFINNKTARQVVSDVPLVSKANNIKIQRKVLPQNSKLDIVQLEEGVNVVLQKPAKSTNSTALNNETSGRTIKTVLSKYFDDNYNDIAEANFKKDKAENLQKLVEEYENDKSRYSDIRKANQKLMQDDAERNIAPFTFDNDYYKKTEAFLQEDFEELKQAEEEYFNDVRNWEDLWIFRE